MMATSEFDKHALSNRIAEKITHQIITGELKPGEKLVENLYAEEFGISRAPIREAIYLLTIEGLVEKIPRKGAVVKHYSPNEIYDLLEIRNMLESMAMKRIKEHGVDPAVIKKMNSLLDTMQEERDVNHYAQLNQLFHKYIIEMSQSETIKTMYNRLTTPLLTIQSISFSYEGNIEKSIEEHSLLIHLLRSQKLDEAQELLEKHNHDVVVGFKR